MGWDHGTTYLNHSKPSVCCLGLYSYHYGKKLEKKIVAPIHNFLVNVLWKKIILKLTLFWEKSESYLQKQDKLKRKQAAHREHKELKRSSSD